MMNCKVHDPSKFGLWKNLEKVRKKWDYKLGKLFWKHGITLSFVYFEGFNADGASLFVKVEPRIIIG